MVPRIRIRRQGSCQASAEHFQQCAEFLLLRNRGLGPLEQSKEIRMAKGGKRAGAGRPAGSPNKLTIRRVEEVVRSGKRPPAENLRIIADRAMAMAAFYQPELTFGHSDFF
jgi:hypothetical protein